VNQGPLLTTVTSGVTRKPHRYLVLAALCMYIDITFYVIVGKSILGATIQIPIGQCAQAPGVCAPRVQTVLSVKAFVPFSSVCCCYLAPFRLLTLYSK
jgi:hypothetical protein